MKLLLCLLSSILVFLEIYGWTSIEMTDNSTNHPGYCYSKKEGVGAMEKGEVKTQAGKCVRVSCGEGGRMRYAGCGVRIYEHPCTLVQDLTKPYPECCPKCPRE